MDEAPSLLFVALARPADRVSAARALASALGAEQSLIFVRDGALGVHIPAPGMPQTIHAGPSWRDFLASCARPGWRRGTVELPPGTSRPAWAIGTEGMVLVFIGGGLDEARLGGIEPLLPLLEAALEAEQDALLARAEAAAAQATAQRAEALAAALDSARAEGAKLNAELRAEHVRRDDFLAMLAHELRNPLSPLATSIELLKRRSQDPATLKLLELMARQTRQLSRLIEDLLDVSRVRLGRIDLRRSPLSLRDLIADTLAAARQLLDARHHSVHTHQSPDPLFVHADPVRLSQVFANLLHNAAKYTDPGGRVDVVSWRDGNEAFVRISDNGIGISSEMLPRVFELFSQAPVSLDRSQGGLGIGLTLVRALVQLHGGRITAASSGLGKGSAFTVQLPLCDAPAAPSAPPAPASAAAAPPRALRVLVIEDNVDAAESLAEIVRLSGHQVEIAHGGLSALQIGVDLDPDLIMLDIGLPEMDGYELARRLRRSLRRATVLVAITGYGTDEDRRRSREAGLDDHVVKPLMPEALLRILDLTLKRVAADTPAGATA